MPPTSPPAASRRERQRTDRRRMILSASLAVFADEGYEQATIDRVAERAGIGKGTVYNYFPEGKEAILMALIDELYDGIRAAIANWNADLKDAPADTAADFRDLIAHLIGHFDRNRAAFLLMMKEAHRMMLGGDCGTAADLTARRDAVVEEMVPAIEAAIRAGRIKAYPPHAVAHLLLGNVQGYLLCTFADMACGRMPENLLPPVDTAAEFITDVLFNGLLSHRT